jgi:hypothetical protein
MGGVVIAPPLFYSYKQGMSCQFGAMDYKQRIACGKGELEKSLRLGWRDFLLPLTRQPMIDARFNHLL